jgi:hypothetical protein
MALNFQIDDITSERDTLRLLLSAVTNYFFLNHGSIGIDISAYSNEGELYAVTFRKNTYLYALSRDGEWVHTYPIEGKMTFSSREAANLAFCDWVQAHGIDALFALMEER